MKKIRKAVFPVAGLGTRLLPATKSIPKEMLPIVDTPLIQYAIDEAIEAGIEQFIFVTGRNKHALEDYFDIQFELYDTLRLNGKNTEYSSLLQKHLECGTTCFTRQQELLGLGHAVWCARHLVEDEPFAIILPDMFMRGHRGCLKQMLEVYKNNPKSNIVSLNACLPKDSNTYGIVKYTDIQKSYIKITDMVEKPRPEEAPSNLYLSGRYILQPEIFKALSTKKIGYGQEIQLTDAMLILLEKQDFYGSIFNGDVFDCGSKIGFVLANVAVSLDHKDLKDRIKTDLNKILSSMDKKICTV